MNVQKRSDVSIYCLSSGPQLPEWLGEQARRNLNKRDESIRRRIELIQDFQMPASSSKLVQSADGRYIIAAGTYPPRIRCYDVHELTMKFERYLDAAVLDLVMLSEDYGKMALLREDRFIDFHAPYGAHESIRIPTFGRALAYEPSTCELLVAAKGNKVFRVNLDEGRFNEPWSFEPSSSSSASSTCITVNRSHPLATIGCDDGIVRFWDSRSPDTIQPFLKLDVHSATAGYGYADESFGAVNVGEITSIAHDKSGLYMAVGTGGGLVALYDVRSSRPLHVKEHKHGLPIHTIKFHAGSGMVLSSDDKLIKVWRYKSSSSNNELRQTSVSDASGEAYSSEIGAVKVNIEGIGKLADFIVAGDETDPHGDNTGVLLCATDQPKMESYYVPAIGVAPKWCSFLENITEELEEQDLQRKGSSGAELVRDGHESIYENYKFVSRDEVDKLGISNLIGSPLLRGYMHGYFMDVNLYNRVKAVANPFEYEEYQKKKLKERMEAKRTSRIEPRASDKKARTAVNPDLAERLQDKAASTTKAGKVASNLLSDERFGSLFTNPDFHVDEEDEDFKLRNPSGVAAVKRKLNNLDSDASDSEVEEDEESARPDDDSAALNQGEPSDNDYSSESDNDSLDGVKVRGEAYEEMKRVNRKQKKTKQANKNTKKSKKKISMHEAEALDSKEAVAFGLGGEGALDRAQRLLERQNIPLAKRVAMEAEDERLVVRVAGGSKEVAFIPRDTKKKLEEEAKHAEMERSHKSKRVRRGVKELGLKKPYRKTQR